MIHLTKKIDKFIFFVIPFLGHIFFLHAQISIDNSLETPAQTLQGPDYRVKQTLGAREGNNLFHSFDEFNIHTGESATFTGDADIQRVISRVTGGNLSNIDGLLKSEIPDADFFLINPAGVLFGPNATIDINGSFNVSTANYLRFGENDQLFSQPLENEILSTDAPTAYGFIGAEIGKITFDQSELSLGEDEALSVIGGGIHASASRLEVPGGEINMVSVNSEGEVKVSNSESGLVKFDVESFQDFGEINFTAGAEINVNGDGGGAVSILGKNMTLDGSSIVTTTTGSTSGENIEISLTESLNLEKGAAILSSTVNTGNAGNINIRANSITIDSQGIAPSRITVETHLVEDGGKGGNLSIDTMELQLANGGELRASTFGSGDGGILTVTAETVLVDGQNSQFLTGIFAESFSVIGPGDAGDIFIHSTDLEVVNGGIFSVSTFGGGDGGRLAITAETILIGGENSQNFTRILADSFMFHGGGKGGEVNITATDLRLVKGGFISASTSGSGDGGNLTVTADSVYVDRQNSQLFTGIVAQSGSVNGGKGGDILVDSTDLQLVNGGIISASTFGSGDGGSLTISTESVLVDGKNSQFFTGIVGKPKELMPAEKAGIFSLILRIWR